MYSREEQTKAIELYIKYGESADCEELKGTRMQRFKNEGDLTGSENAKLDRARLSGACKQSGKAYRMRILLQQMLDAGSKLTMEDARGKLKGWCRWAIMCRIPEVAEVGRMIKRHLEGVLR